MDIYRAKLGVDEWIPILLVATADGFTALTGITVATAYYATAGATSLSIYTIASASWREAGRGRYGLSIGASEFPAQSRINLVVEAAGCRPYEAVVEVCEVGEQAMVEAIMTARQVLAGYAVANSTGNTIVIYQPDGVNSRLTLTKVEAAPTITRTPS